MKDAKAAHVRRQGKTPRWPAPLPNPPTTLQPSRLTWQRPWNAAAEKNEANYKAAKERCDALSGDVKSSAWTTPSACTAKTERATDRGAGGRSAACPAPATG